MNNNSDPTIHRHREGQVIQHVEKLLADDRLRVDTTQGRRPITTFMRDVSRGDRAIDVKKLMIDMGSFDRELQNQLPIGQMLDVALTQSQFFFFTKTVGRLRVVCVSPTRQLIAGEPVTPMSAADVAKTLAAMPPSLGGAPTTIVLASTGGFGREALELAGYKRERTVILVEPNGAGGWTAHAPAEAKAIADLFDPEGDADKRERVFKLIEENKIDLLGSGISTDKLAVKAQLPVPLVESAMKDYARKNPGLLAKKLDGRFVLFREGSGTLATDSGGSMGLMDKMKTLFARKGDNEKKIAFLSERKAALSQQRDRAYEDMTALEQQEAQLKTEFKESTGAITKRRITGQMLQLRKDLERRQQLLNVLNQQVNVVTTHLHNLEVVQQGQGAHLPDTDEITEDAVKAEEVLAQLEADSELAGSVGQIGSTGMSDEEKALFEELERETGGGEAESSEPEVIEKETPMKVAEKPSREPASRTPANREPTKGSSTPTASRWVEPEAG